jgi:hypothetical protein
MDQSVLVLVVRSRAAAQVSSSSPSSWPPLRSHTFEPVVIATVEGRRYLVSMIGPESDWVKNVEAAAGDVVIRYGRRQRVRLVALPNEQRAPILREYVRVAASGRQHFPVAVGAPLLEFNDIAWRYPVYRIDDP